jgi:ubiquinone/menaquinone biosynthesis C-methylase UbiE
MPDAIFADPRLAQIYDWLEFERPDLDAYVAMAREFKAQSVLDVGCGTGTLCLLLAAEGLDAVGVDPAEASLDVARSKRGAQNVQWISGDATHLPPMQVDLGFMTANVAQVFLSDDDWSDTIKAIHVALKPGGRLVFETRNPAEQAWLGWTRELTETVTTIPNIGEVTGWCELVNVVEPFVSFRWTYEFSKSNEVVTSESTLRFRSSSEIEDSLVANGFVVEEIRDAPDRPGLEFVFVASAKI